ncbi:MAG TPA: CxxxxCH/CxxCH domain-containing protein [Anaeromyxobacter sp.]
MRNLSAVSALVAVVALAACAKARHIEEGRGAACTGCHGGQDNETGAPPFDTHGVSTSVAVGAHTAHLDAGVRCDTCHIVPTDAGSPGHMDTSPAEVTFGTVAGLDPVYDYTARSCSSVYCHAPPTAPGGATPDPSWNGTLAGAPCGSCHEDSPTFGAHQVHLFGKQTNDPVISAGVACSDCHGGANRALPTAGTVFAHIDGTAEVTLEWPGRNTIRGTYSAGTCTSSYCHGNLARNPKTGNSPSWTETSGQSRCDVCHEGNGFYPTTDTMNGRHSLHRCSRCHNSTTSFSCQGCHAGFGRNPAAVDTATHVNGTVDVSPSVTVGGKTFTITWTPGNPGSCTTDCHTWHGAGASQSW